MRRGRTERLARTNGSDGLDAGALAVAMLWLDPAGRVRRWNEAAAVLFPTRHDSLRGTQIAALIGRDVIGAPAPGRLETLDVMVDRGVGPRTPMCAHVTADPASTDGAIVLLMPRHATAADPSDRAPRVVPWLEVATRARIIDGDARCAVVGLAGLTDVNVAYSRSTGDAVLTAVHARLDSGLGPDAVVARIAGERVAVIAPVATTTDDFGRRIVDLVRAPIDTPLGRVAIGCSVGLANGDPQSGLVLLDRAERSLATALRLGSGAVSDDEGDGAAARDTTRGARLAGTLVDAVENGGITAHFQPVIDMASGEVAELEALARWRRDDDGHLEAAEFLGAAEFTGSIVALGEGILEEALTEAQRVLSASSSNATRRPQDSGALRMSVNVSLRELLDPDFLPMLATRMDRWALPAGSLQLELTGPIEAGLVDRVSSAVAAARAVGARVVLDSFGGSATDLHVLRVVEVDGIKLDPQLVGDLTAGSRGERFTRAVLRLARELGIDVVAKGVEQKRQHHHLRRLGCKLAQGFLYGEPVAAVDLPAVLSQIRRLTAPTSSARRQERLEALIGGGALDHLVLDDLMADLAASTGAEVAALCVVELEQEWVAACAGCDELDPVPDPDDDFGAAVSRFASTAVDLIELDDGLDAARDRFDVVLGEDGPTPAAERSLIDLGVHAVAGARVVLSDGTSIGAVCVTSSDAREFGEFAVLESVRTARAIAVRVEWVIAQLERRRVSA